VSGAEQRPFGGFEKDRGTLKYCCPALHYNIKCAGAKRCPVAGAIRISIDEDRRIFTPLSRSSCAWEKAYRKRTAVERVNRSAGRVRSGEKSAFWILVRTLVPRKPPLLPQLQSPYGLLPLQRQFLTSSTLIQRENGLDNGGKVQLIVLPLP
jgi:hypothetical protein